MTKNSLLFAAGTSVLTSIVSSAQNEPSQDTMKSPTGVESTTNNPPVAAAPEVATDVAGVPRQRTTGQAPNVTKRMGAEMDSAGDQRAAPDEE
jgi:hypothetical protein